METRNVIIINSRTQFQTKFQSSATTLGELKSEATSHGVDSTGMTWFEGHLRAEFVDDNALLPTSVTYRGAETTDLVFMITTPNKKIESGADRKELFTQIKENKLENACKETYGKNYTQCSNDLLEKIIKDSLSRVSQETVNSETSDKKYDEKPITDIELIDKVIKAIKKLTDILYDYDCIGTFESEEIYAILDGNEYNNTNDNTDKNCMSKKEIDNMFDFVK